MRSRTAPRVTPCDPPSSASPAAPRPRSRLRRSNLNRKSLDRLACDGAADRLLSPGANQRGPPARDEAGMLNQLVWTMVKVVIASLIVGTVMTHFGITTEHIMAKTGLTTE